jgi:hypothetical protein
LACETKCRRRSRGCFCSSCDRNTSRRQSFADALTRWLWQKLSPEVLSRRLGPANTWPFAEGIFSHRHFSPEQHTTHKDERSLRTRKRSVTFISPMFPSLRLRSNALDALFGPAPLPAFKKAPIPQAHGRQWNAASAFTLFDHGDSGGYFSTPATVHRGRSRAPNQKSLEMPYVTAPIQAALMATANPMPACGQAIRKASLAFVTIDALPQSPWDVASLQLRECDCRHTSASIHSELWIKPKAGKAMHRNQAI